MLAVAAVTLVGALGAVIVRLGRHGFHFSAFVVAGRRWVDPTRAPHGLLVAPGGGYDGQFVYRLALAPFSQRVTARGITLDSPAYRQQRIGLPVLAHLVDVATPLGAAAALVVLEVVALVLVGTAAAVLLARCGRNRLWALLIAFAPAMSIGLARDLTEPPAWAALLLGLICWLDRRWLLAGLAFTVAMLTRETSAAVLVGLGLWTLFRLVPVGKASRLRAQAPALLAIVGPGAAEVAWQLWLRHVWGVLPASAGKDNVGAPLIGPLRDLVEGLWDPSRGQVAARSVAVTWELERLLTLAVLLAGIACWRRSRLPEPLKWGWAGAAFLALTLGNWSYDVQFVRATHEALDLGVLLVITSLPAGLGRRITARTALLGAVGTVSLWVGVIYPLAT